MKKIARTSLFAGSDGLSGSLALAQDAPRRDWSGPYVRVSLGLAWQFHPFEHHMVRVKASYRF